ncbi:MAG: malate dehydrogenase, partial [candidate division NC10 bacterium]|nr:malate dehydrogenase [candidate division NC10 bacterium]
MRSQVTIVGGAGNVGATVGQYLVAKELADVVLIDILESVQHGRALDLLQTSPVLGSDSRIIGTKDYRDTADSDIVVVT